MRIDLRLSAIVAVALTLVHAAAFAAPPRPSLFRSNGLRSQPTSGEAYTSGRLVVGLRAGSGFATRAKTRAAESFQGRWGRSVRAARHVAGDSYVLDVRDAAMLQATADAIARDADVAYVEPDYLYHASVRPNDEFYSRLYAFPKVGAEQAWDITTGNPNILLAVVDTGIYAGHPDFGQNIVTGADFVNGDNDASDDEGHGTHTAGIMASLGNNGRGVAGMCWQCKVLSVKVLDNQGSGSSVTVASGIRYAADRGARVINLSLGGENDSRLLHDAVKYATSRGALVVVAAGNEALEGNPVEYPAAYPEALAVAATDGNDGHAPFSNYESYVDIAAPGVDIGSTLWAAGEPEVYGLASGTSEAAPFVAGLAGLIWSANPALSNEDVRRILLETADDLGTPGRDDFFGAGRINAYRAVQAAAAPLPPPPPVATPVPPALPPAPPVVPSDARLFPETGKVLRGEFRRFWEANGGLPVFGFPLTDEQMEQTAEGSFVVQYFERNRFEFHPEQPAPFNVQLGRLGDTLLQRSGIAWQTLPKGQPVNGCQFFAETGHTVCEPFLSYWRGHGLQDAKLDTFGRALALFGMPITEPRMETNSSGDNVMTQWFERARFEDHGAAPGQPGVLLGLLGGELRAAPLTSPPAPAPGLPPAPPPVPAPVATCPQLPTPIDARVRPGQCLAFGVEMSMDVFGFAPGEEIAYWLTAPNNEVFGSTETIAAEGNGSLNNLVFPTDILTPGTWYWVFQGKQTNHQSIVYFHVYSP